MTKAIGLFGRAYKSFCLIVQTNRQTDRQIHSGVCRVASATKKYVILLIFSWDDKSITVSAFSPKKVDTQVFN